VSGVELARDVGAEAGREQQELLGAERPPGELVRGSALPARERNSARARTARLSSPVTPGQWTLSRPDALGSALTSSASSIDAISEQIGWRPSSRG
jgi:hypothetical protein